MENTSLIDAAIRTWLSELYRAPDRHYHGLAHVEAMLSLAKQYHAGVSDSGAVEAAIWFHDAIYDSRRSDNETRSAALAREALAGNAQPERLSRIAGMIEATATHALPDLRDRAATEDAALFLDMDLSILGAPPADFDAYEDSIRREYGWVEEPGWRVGRAAVLAGFLARPRIYHTDAFRERFEGQARANIRRSLAALGK